MTELSLTNLPDLSQVTRLEIMVVLWNVHITATQGTEIFNWDFENYKGFDFAIELCRRLVLLGFKVTETPRISIVVGFVAERSL